jgi:hypothetical protein
MMITANPTPSPAAATASASPSLELGEARLLRDVLKGLLRREQHAMAAFLIALADFDRRRGWEALGHASLFAFINADLGLSPAPTYWRKEAARLLQDFPELVEPLRQGRLCLTTMGELAKVLTEANREEVLPRFLGISTRDAKEVVAELKPRPSPPMRTVVTPLAPVRRVEEAHSLFATPTSAASIAGPGGLLQQSPANTDPGSLWAPKAPGTEPARVEPRRDDVDPLTAELSRLSTTVSRRFLQKLKSARAGLGHALPGATTEQVLEAALDLLLEKQARARGQVKRPRKTVTSTVVVAAGNSAAEDGSSTTSADPTTPLAAPALALIPTEPPPPRREGSREAIPAAVRRAVWERDQGRCQWPLDAGGVCGSTHRLELDHIVPWARFSGSTENDLRLLCNRHNLLAARSAFGDRLMARYASRYPSNPYSRSTRQTRIR